MYLKIFILLYSIFFCNMLLCCSIFYSFVVYDLLYLFSVCFYSFSIFLNALLWQYLQCCIMPIRQFESEFDCRFANRHCSHNALSSSSILLSNTKKQQILMFFVILLDKRYIYIYKLSNT